MEINSFNDLVRNSEIVSIFTEGKVKHDLIIYSKMNTNSNKGNLNPNKKLTVAAFKRLYY